MLKYIKFYKGGSRYEESLLPNELVQREFFWKLQLCWFFATALIDRAFIDFIGGLFMFCFNPNKLPSISNLTYKNVKI